MKKNIRRRRADSSSDEEDGNGSGQEGGGKKSLAEVVLTLREEMKQRKARGGIQTASTLEVAAPEEPKAKKRPAAAVEEEDDEEAAKQKSIGEMMSSAFTGMRYVKKDDRTPHEKIMEQYIKEKLAAQGLGQKQPANKEGGDGTGAFLGPDGEAAAAPSKVSRQDKLRQITEEIHANARPGGKGVGGEEAAIGEGAPIAYGAGIAEVALPIEFRLRNIEATEAAQRALEEKGSGQRPEEIVGNMTTNYFHHRREHAIEMRAREGKPAGLFRRPGGEGPQGRNATTDDMIYNRFHKRNRR